MVSNRTAFGAVPATRIRVAEKFADGRRIHMRTTKGPHQLSEEALTADLRVAKPALQDS